MLRPSGQLGQACDEARHLGNDDPDQKARDVRTPIRVELADGVLDLVHSMWSAVIAHVHGPLLAHRGSMIRLTEPVTSPRVTASAATPHAAQRLVLGTAQLGFDYGVTNARGRVADDEAGAMLRRAVDAGIEAFDTAPGYGVSEEVIGRLLDHPDARVSTKTIAIDGGAVRASSVAEVEVAFRRSLDRLRRDHVDALLVHRAADLALRGSERLVDALRTWQTEGLAARIGVSVYDARELETALGAFDPDIVQLPLSVVDQRLAASGHVAELARRGIEVVARSVFLQGLLIDPLPHLDGLGPARDAIDSIARSTGSSRLTVCLRHVLQVPGVSAVVVGATTVAELDDIIRAAAVELPLGDLSALAVDDRALIDPRSWHSFLMPGRTR